MHTGAPHLLQTLLNRHTTGELLYTSQLSTDREGVDMPL